MTLCYIDTETTGLDSRIHQPYEVCFWREDAVQPTTLHLPHTLDYADPKALDVGQYFERGMHTFAGLSLSRPHVIETLVRELCGVTLVGSNPAFDARMLGEYIGAPVWSHRMIDVGQAGMWLFGDDAPMGLGKLADSLAGRGHVIPEPDHTAEGDVRATRAVHRALLEERQARIDAWAGLRAPGSPG